MLGMELGSAGVGCSECGRKRGLGGGFLRDAVLAVEDVCCDGCAGVELMGGGPESAIGKSAGGVTIRGNVFGMTCDEGRTGV
jgi:hypothetical protein